MIIEKMQQLRIHAHFFAMADSGRVDVVVAEVARM